MKPRALKAIDLLVIVGISALLSFLVFWAHFFIAGILLGSILHVDSITLTKCLFFYIPLIACAIISVFNMGDTRKDKGKGKKLDIFPLCLMLWLISIPVSIELMLFSRFGGSLVAFDQSDVSLSILIKPNIFSFFFTTGLAYLASVMIEKNESIMGRKQDRTNEGKII